MLSAQQGMSVNRALPVLRQHSRRHGTPLTDVAAQVLDGTLDVVHHA